MLTSSLLKGTLDGSIFFKLSGYFIDLEKKESQKGIGDSKEGSWSRALNNRSLFMVETEDGVKVPLHVKSGSFHKTYEGMRKVPICCFTCLDLDKDFYQEGESYKLKPEVMNNLSEQFKDRDIILFEASQFFLRLDEAVKNEGYNLDRDLITYYDERKEPHPIEYDKYSGNPYPALFFKRKFFEFQKEYRVALRTMTDNDVFINMGNIRDITTLMTKDHFDNFKVQVLHENE